MDVGAEFARARRLLGLSIGEIATRTGISRDMLSAIEENRTEDVPVADVRGALRAYAAEVQLDPDDMTGRYAAQLDRDPYVEVLADSKWDIDAFPAEAALASEPSEAALASDPAEAALASEAAVVESGNVSPVSTERPEYPARFGHTYRAVAVVALLGIAGGFLLAEYSHRWRTTPAESPDTSPRRSTLRELNDPPQNTAPQPDNDARGQITARAPGAVGETSGPLNEPESAVSTSGGASAVPDEPTRRPNAPGASPASAAKTDGPAAGTRQDLSAQNLSGWWSVTNRVESTAYSPFDHLNLGYRMKLTQKGDHISGTGHKWMENGRQVPTAQRTAIVVDGDVQRQRVTLSFTEYGTRRTSTGKFVYDIANTGVLEGSFTSDVAQSKGSSRAARMPSPD